jgi:hypothetical protein
MRTPSPAGHVPNMPPSPDPQASATARPAAISRRALLRGTAATGIAVALAGAASVLTAAPALASQGGWRWCNQCQGLWYGFNGPSNKPCPLNPSLITHNSSGSGNYTLMDGNQRANQDGWRWCRFCQGLWYTGNSCAGFCPARGAQGHSSQGSVPYALFVTDIGSLFPPGQELRAWCYKCQGLSYRGVSVGYCPAGGGHSAAGSLNYAVPLN